MKEIRYCARCHETYEVNEAHTNCIRLPKGCKNVYKPSYGWLYMYLGSLLFFFIAIVLALFLLSSCNFSVNLIHSGHEGSIDEVDEAKPDIKPNLTLPISPV